MATFPFLAKDKPAAPQSEKIAVKRPPRTLTMDDIADDVVAKFPDRDPDEIRQILKEIRERRLELLLSGTDIVMDDGSYWTLDADGRTILLCIPEDKARQR